MTRPQASSNEISRTDDKATPSTPRVLLLDSPPGERPSWLELSDPVSVVRATDLASVERVLSEVEAATKTGLFAAGFLTYEAAAAFDPSFTTHEPGRLPLAWFGIFPPGRRLSRLPVVEGPPVAPLSWTSDTDAAAFTSAVDSIHHLIARGETYQTNFTFRFRSPFDGDAFRLFANLVTAQPVSYAAYLDLGDHAICSLSPELFFDLAGNHVVSRPMKGTARRGTSAQADQQLALELYNSRKDRAENLMIVDMLRNDLGRIAEPGSVVVESLFDLETYESVHQMTSTISARTEASLPEIFQALFPCASITGAPKVRTMEILAALEATPRGIYTGAIGFVAPQRRAQFNVAIRTVHVDRGLQTAEYGSGAGIVWDSVAEDEFRECHAKALALSLDRPPFDLLETLCWDPASGYFLLERHLERLERSATFFSHEFDRSAVIRALDTATSNEASSPRRVRLLLGKTGATQVEWDDLPSDQAVGWRVALSPEAVDRDNVFLHHKTTAREIYDRARESAAAYDDVLLWNADGAITESTVANVVFQLQGGLFTPPVTDGLLAGTFRQELLAHRDLRVRTLVKEELSAVENFWLVNSVRRWIRVDRVDEPGPGGYRPIWRNTRRPGS